MELRNTSNEVSRLNRMGVRISGDKMGGERGGIVVVGKVNKVVFGRRRMTLVTQVCT